MKCFFTKNFFCREHNVVKIEKRCIVLFVFILLSSPILGVQVSVRELADISSLRDNQISGYGLVIGLEGSGDSRNFLSREAFRALLSRRNIEPEIRDRNFTSKNMAAVFVSASFPPGASQGGRIDVWISSVGDAKSIAGGYLLQTPLLGADGIIYAVAQQKVPDVAHEQSNASRLDKKNTVLVPNAAIIERNLEQNFISRYRDDDDNLISTMTLSLRNFDLTNAIAVVEGINSEFTNAASLSDGGKIVVRVPQANPLPFIASVLEKKINIRETTKVVIDSASGTIVMGGGVGISKVSVTKGGITIEIQNAARGANSTIAWNNNSQNNRETEAKSILMSESTTVDDLVSGLNKLGLPAKDIIDILRAIGAAGALHGKLEIL